MSERVGYRRLYYSRGCKLSEREEALIEFEIPPDQHAQVYLGPRPKFGVWIENRPTERFLWPGATPLLMSGQFTRDINGTPYEGRFFTEIAVFVDVEVDEEILKDFEAKESQANEKLLQLAEARLQAFRASLDLIAGVIGMRVHPQFVLDQIDENPVALRGRDDFAHRHIGNWVRTLQETSLTESGIEYLKAVLNGFAPNTRAVEFASMTLSWMLRAWSQFDPVNEFISLFIPLEMALEAHIQDEVPDRSRIFDEIRSVLVTNGGENVELLLSTFNRLVEAGSRRSLVERFTAMAQEIALEGWQQDVEAFKRFNRMRNDLLHRGQSTIRLQVDVEAADIRRIETLAARYLNFVLFHDDASYAAPSRNDS